MKHVITFEEEDILQFVKDMLSMQGVAPADEIKIEELRNGEQKEGTTPKHYITVVCRETTPITNCPLCKRLLATASKEEKSSAVGLVQQTEEEEELEEPEEPADAVVLDEELGESLEPPEPPQAKNRESAGASFASLRAQSERVRREREPTLPRRPRGNK